MLEEQQLLLHGGWCEQKFLIFAGKFSVRSSVRRLAKVTENKLIIGDHGTFAPKNGKLLAKKVLDDGELFEEAQAAVNVSVKISY